MFGLLVNAEPVEAFPQDVRLFVGCGPGQPHEGLELTGRLYRQMIDHQPGVGGGLFPFGPKPNT